MKEIPEDLPGAELIKKGIHDLREGRLTLESLLVSIGARRIRESGVDVPEGLSTPEERLYALIAEEEGDGAHSQYNAWVRRLISFEQALECASR